MNTLHMFSGSLLFPIPIQLMAFTKSHQKKNTDGSFVYSIIPVANIRRSIHLFPRFGQFAPNEWSSTNVLDKCSTFFVNNFTDRHLYRILY